MADYGRIKGYIEDIFEGETANGKEYLGIKFYTQDPHDYDTNIHEIRWWFSAGALEITQDKIKRLLAKAGIEYNGAMPKTVKAALKILSNEKLAALEIPITVSPNEYEGKTRAQYDLGWDGSENVVQSGFSKFSDLVGERLAAIKAMAPPAAASSPAVSASPSSSVKADPYDDIPF